MIARPPRHARGQPLDLRNCQPFVVVRDRDFYSWNKSPDHEQPLEKAVVECFPIVIILNFHPNLEIGMYYYYSEWYTGEARVRYFFVP